LNFKNTTLKLLAQKLEQRYGFILIYVAKVGAVKYDKLVKKQITRSTVNLY